VYRDGKAWKDLAVGSNKTEFAFHELAQAAASGGFRW